VAFGTCIWMHTIQLFHSEWVQPKEFAALLHPGLRREAMQRAALVNTNGYTSKAHNLKQTDTDDFTGSTERQQDSRQHEICQQQCICQHDIFWQGEGCPNPATMTALRPRHFHAQPMCICSSLCMLPFSKFVQALNDRCPSNKFTAE